MSVIRVAAYCRVSTDQGDQANSFESQKRYFQDCIRRNPDWELQGIYADEGISGTGTKKRRQFNAMIAAARAGQLDLIITKEVSRFARNTLDALAYTRQLHRWGVGVFFLLDNIDTRKQEGELRLTLMSSIAQEESRKTSERVKWGQTRRMERGVVFGGSLLGYDVSEGVMTINPEGAEIVRRIFHAYLREHKGTTVIARELRREGVLSSRGNCRWSSATVLKILKNEKYCGDLVQKKTYTPDYLTHEKKYNRGQEKLIILRNHHEPILDRETWEEVQREIKRRSRESQGKCRGNRYLLSGKIRCGPCSGSFVARTKKNGTGAAYRVWRCGRAVREGVPPVSAGEGLAGCGVGRQIREDTAMELLRRCVQAVPMDWTEFARHLAGVVGEILWEEEDGTEGKRRRLERDMEETRRKKEWVLEAYLGGKLSEADALFLNGSCDRKLEQLEWEQSAAGQPEGGAGVPTEEEICAAVLEIVRGEAENERFFGRLLDHMTVWPDGRVEVLLCRLSARWIFSG